MLKIINMAGERNFHVDLTQSETELLETKHSDG
jgi:hypothetical protein